MRQKKNFNWVFSLTVSNFSKDDCLCLVLAISFHLLIKLDTGNTYDSCESDLTMKPFILPHTTFSFFTVALFIIDYLYLYHIIVYSINSNSSHIII